MKNPKSAGDKVSSEMPLDEVLSSIKEMVIGNEPPVLELTNIVTEDKALESDVVKNSSKVQNSEDIKTFLQMAQSNGVGNEGTLSAPIGKNTNQGQILETVLQKIVTPLIENWIKENLPRITGEIVEKELRKILKY